MESILALPEHVRLERDAASRYADIDKTGTEDRVKALKARVPKPTGFRILVVKPKIEDMTEGGIVKPDTFVKKEEAGSVVGVVLELGPMAYKDEGKFPTGPWCKPQDFVLLPAYAGSRFAIDGIEFIIVNDDVILGTVEDPRGINRAY
jgi:co-chaperonin GroES (HSP10)